ncbi:MAG TPA: hypothetical protein DCM87_10255 [Planctomycetes bacterium]|nr:hypothetical protein [Planctomycetota bacterium]
MGDTPKLDTQLVEALNREYRLTPTVPAPAGLGREDRGARAAHVAARLDRLVGLRGRTILEIGCGAGDLAFELAGNYGAYVTGIDIGEREDWKTLRHPNLTLSAHDVTAGECALPENGFDRIISRAVWEHIRHPFAALVQCRRLLCPAGKKYLYANLYRSAIASHLYRTLFFPWPHLLFSHDVLASWLDVERIGGAYWVNKLTYAQYLCYFRKLGFYITHERLETRAIDRAFYDRFEDRLGLYPRFDLELDFFEVVLEFDRTNPKAPIPDPMYRTGA